MPKRPADAVEQPIAVVEEFDHEEGSVAIRCPVPGLDGVYVRLGLSRDHVIWVERPAAWCGSFQAGPERYRWMGGVPSPTDPAIPHAGDYDKDDAAWSDPILAVLRANRERHKETPAERAEAREIWGQAWAMLSPHLADNAAALASTFDYKADLYTALAHRTDLCDHVELCPPLGVFLSLDSVERIPEIGVSLQEVAQTLVSPPDLSRPIEVTPGFMAWARAMKWDRATLPAFGTNASDRAPAMKGFVRGVARIGASIDPNGIHKIENPNEWLLLNLALANPQWHKFVPHILKDPAAALNQVVRCFPPEIKLSRRERVTQVLSASSQWAIAEPEKFQAAQGFGAVVKKMREWDRTMRGKEYDDHIAYEEWKVAYEAELLAEEERQARVRAARVIAEARARGTHWVLSPTIDPVESFPTPPPAREVQAGPYRLVYLKNGAELQEESLKMHHCVVSYAGQCKNGAIWIFSLRSGDRPVATIEVQQNTLAVVQQQGNHNRGFTPEMRAAVQQGMRAMFPEHLGNRRGPRAGV